jgi:hypothetical protein
MFHVKHFRHAFAFNRTLTSEMIMACWPEPAKRWWRLCTHGPEGSSKGAEAQLPAVFQKEWRIKL